MRNPFIRGGAVPPDRLAFIVATRGGSASLLAGALFWAGAGVSGLLAPRVWPKVYLYGGFSVPIVGWLFAKAQSVTVPPKSALVPLVAIAATITLTLEKSNDAEERARSCCAARDGLRDLPTLGPKRGGEVAQPRLAT